MIHQPKIAFLRKFLEKLQYYQRLQHHLPTVVVILDGMKNIIGVFSDAPTHTRPADKVNVGVLDVVFIEKLIVAFAADLERGTYPIFLAKDTTFSLKVAESKKRFINNHV